MEKDRIQSMLDDPYIRLRDLERLFIQPQNLSTQLISETGRVHVVLMYHHLALVSVIFLWLPFHAFRTTALAIAPQGTIITALNQTRSDSAVNLILSEGISNKTLTTPPNVISYRVSNSPTTLLLHSFGPMIPVNEYLQAVAIAVGIAFDYIDEAKGKQPIARGLFEITHDFLNLDAININVADFREIGQPMNYHTLCNVLRGLGEFVLLPERKTQELQFEVEVRDVGYVGTGHVGYKPAATPTASVA